MLNAPPVYRRSWPSGLQACWAPRPRVHLSRPGSTSSTVSRASSSPTATSGSRSTAARPTAGHPTRPSRLSSEDRLHRRPAPAESPIARPPPSFVECPLSPVRETWRETRHLWQRLSWQMPKICVVFSRLCVDTLSVSFTKIQNIKHHTTLNKLRIPNKNSPNTSRSEANTSMVERPDRNRVSRVTAPQASTVIRSASAGSAPAVVILRSSYGALKSEGLVP